jgi:hypothetical protein
VEIACKGKGVTMNMSYCQFENTFRDLKQCADAIANEDELSKTENNYKRLLIQLCRDIAEETEE